MLVGYARVSTTDQTLALQHDALTKAGCTKIYTDTASGAQTERKGLQEAISYVRPGDTLVVWKLDRLGRSLKDLITRITQLNDRKIGFKSLTPKALSPEKIKLARKLYADTSTTAPDGYLLDAPARARFMLDRSSEERMAEMIKQRKPLSAADTQAKARILSLLKGEKSGVLFAMPDFVISYNNTSNIFQVDLRTVNVMQTKQDAVRW